MGYILRVGSSGIVQYERWMALAAISKDLAGSFAKVGALGPAQEARSLEAAFEHWPEEEPTESIRAEQIGLLQELLRTRPHTPGYRSEADSSRLSPTSTYAAIQMPSGVSTIARGSARNPVGT